MRDCQALIAFIESREAWTFGYGPGSRVHDCARFCDAGTEALTGVRPLAGFAGRWTTPLGAARVIARHGGLADAVSEVMTRVAPTLARRGDVGLTVAGGLVLIEGDLLVGPAASRGLERLSRAELTHAWTVAGS